MYKDETFTSSMLSNDKSINIEESPTSVQLNCAIKIYTPINRDDIRKIEIGVLIQQKQVNKLGLPILDKPCKNFLVTYTMRIYRYGSFLVTNTVRVYTVS